LQIFLCTGIVSKLDCNLDASSSIKNVLELDPYPVGSGQRGPDPESDFLTCKSKYCIKSIVKIYEYRYLTLGSMKNIFDHSKAKVTVNDQQSLI
jgi:hypothetical protein